MSTNVIKWIFHTLSVIVIGVLSFFIIYDAGWLIGDDAIVISHTGWGHMFSPADTVSPTAGRFYPFAYVIYNILPLLELYSAQAHFTLHMLVFIIFAIVCLWVSYRAVETERLSWQDCILILSATLICLARAYSNFLDAYSTIWVDYTLVMIWALCCYYVHKQQSLTAVIVGILSVAYLTYCIETNFIFPLSYGVLGLLFMRKRTTRLEKTYLWCMVGVGLMFLILYFFICYLHIEKAYDGAHGQEITIIGNAVRMFVAQKVLWVVLVVVCWRAYRIFIKKEMYEFWDTILLTGCAYCCGCAIMKLNWVLYYSMASLFTIPAIVHYLSKYLGQKWAWIVMLCLALFISRKVPGYIISNQNGRKATAETMSMLVNEHNSGYTLYWYAPEDNRDWCFELEQRAWLCSSLETQLGYEMDNESYCLRKITDFSCGKGVYILPAENNTLFPNVNDEVIVAGETLPYTVNNFTIIKIQ